ncbi:hypothetical protein SPRG_21939 [Saprolegnia parasitica CBS 223.65]|uniref:J domain-containing protein n=1 Tax=Saprolegnia parasitica (strain CBS 223.65) TaxID=695850 RepID=A0A067BEX1_SAPPC|nr:hypothetical protein SPRG_21939 [Saprolegnia parasitica CBS 223.65]KDO16934.1 hypothetical protein SPRG_21939 [Saprolegnia parasitica CBS 223.65]|eukprot:XP_012212357.1 hypothetical protein SPRG_21939 [Saprolegnia parasitica CBS 223.65]
MGQTKHTKLYDAMGVATDVSAEDLKKAYRRKALQLHPDKRGNTPEAQEEFMAMKAAYDILSDPKQREIYDMMGEDGVKLVSQYGDLGPDELLMAMLGSLSASGPLGKCLIFSFVALFLGFFSTIPLFFCLKIDNDVGWSWLTVFVPMWILDGIYLCCIGCSFLGDDADIHQEPEDRQSKPLRLLGKTLLLTKALLFVACQIFVAMKLQHSIDWSMHLVLAPYYVLEGFYLLEKVITGLLAYSAFARAHATDPSSTFGTSKMSLMLDILNSWTMSVLRLAFALLVALKIEDIITCSWWIVFLPVWIYVITLVVPHIQTYLRRKHRMAHLEEGNGHEDELAPSLFGLFCVFVGVFAAMSPFFILAYRLQSGDFSSFYVLLPWLIMVGLVLAPWVLMILLNLLACCCYCCCGRHVEPKDNDPATHHHDTV